jgi:hypothetical protein
MRRSQSRRRHRARLKIDEILPEYDFGRSRPNKYASHYAKGSIVITLDPDVATV